MQTNDFQLYNIQQKWMPWRGKASNAMVVLINYSSTMPMNADRYAPARGHKLHEARAQAPPPTDGGIPLHGLTKTAVSREEIL